jgi:CheY-like chemotaxis protein/HPt (histidine-containing phosphotransfer) domain-containing protein
LVNLTNNSVKFTERGSVEIIVACEANDGRAARLRFEVRDTGIGVPENRRDRLFQPFMQVDASTTRKYGGTGLGLSICKQLVEALGGRIAYEDRAGGGSIFSFTLTLECGAASLPPRRRLPEKLQGVRGLAVDDVDLNRELLNEHLKQWGVKLDTAPDARSALEMLRQAAAGGEPYELFVLDRQLPDMDGLELASLIHGDETYNRTPMLLLTSMSDNPERSELAQIGIADVLYKPLRQSQLFDALMNMTVDDRSAAYQRTEPFTASHAAEPSLDAQVRRNPTAEGHAGPNLGRRAADRSLEASADAAGLAILVAEDNEVNRMVTEEILRAAGHRYRLVVNGREAVDAAASCRYDLVLMDCQMPVMDGFTAVAEIRRREAEGEKFSKHGRVPIIALTANAVRGDRERCLAAGMDGYVAKPIHRPALYAEIERIWNEARSNDTPAGSYAAAVPSAASAPPTTPEPTAPDHSAAECRTSRETTPPAAPIAATQACAVPTADDETTIPLSADDLLRRCEGDRAFAARLLGKFRLRLPDDVRELEQAASTGDAEAVRRLAHRLKGCAGNVGALALQQRAGTLEVADATADDLAQLRHEVTNCLEAVERLIHEFQTS